MFVFMLIKSKHAVHIMVFGVVTGKVDFIPSFIFPQVQHKGLNHVPGGSKAFWTERVAAGRPTSGKLQKQKILILSVKKCLESQHQLNLAG